MKSEYDIQADKFLHDNGIEFSFVEHGDRCPPYCDGKCLHGHRHRVMLTRTHGTIQGKLFLISFDYWNSHADIMATPGKRLRPYDVLACISSDVHCAEDFEEWCNEIGEDSDSRRAEATWKRCRDFSRKLNRFFTEDELNQLAEIQ